MKQRAWLIALPICVAWVAALLFQFLAGAWPVRAGGALTEIDFVPFYAAGRMALRGMAAEAYDWSALAAEMRSFGGATDGGWLNPPTLLLVMAPLATLPYTVAFACWVLLSGAAYALAVRQVLCWSGAAVIAFVSPAALLAVWHGQASFLTASLAGFALLMLDRRPALAGVLLGALSYKPQLALVFPVLLLAGRRWTTLAAAAATTIGLAALSCAIFGWGSWVAFLTSVPQTGEVFLDGAASKVRQASVYGVVAAASGSAGMATWAHLGFAAAVVVAVLWIWKRSAGGDAGKAAAAAACALLSPYLIRHDATLLVIAICFLVRRGPGALRPGDAPLLVLALLLPGVGGGIWVPLGGLVVLGIAARQIGLGQRRLVDQSVAA